MDRPSDPKAALQRVSDNYHAANQQRDDAMAQLQEVIRECIAAGVPKKRIAELARVSRQTVYDAIR